MLHQESIQDGKKDENLFFIDVQAGNDPSKLKVEKVLLKDKLNESKDLADDDEEDDDLEKLVLGVDDDDVENEIKEFLNNDKRKLNCDGKGIGKKAKWEDEDDIHHKSKVPSVIPTWAQPDKEETIDEEEDEDEDDVEDNVTWRTGNYMTSSKHLPQKNLNFYTCPNINKSYPAKGKLRVLKMMRRAQVAVVGGADSKLTLFQVDGKENLKIQTIAMEKFPVFAAELNVEETEVLVGSMYPSFVTYNMDVGKINKTSVKNIDQVQNTKLFQVSPDGKLMVLVGTFGYVHILSMKSKGLLHTLKSESECIEAVTFSSDGEKLLTHGGDGVVHVWSMRTFKCIFKFQDEGCTRGTSIHMSPNSKYLATGSHTGIVNIYDTSTLFSTPTSTKFHLPHPSPLKVIPNITSSCTKLLFNDTSELLAIASNYADNAVKLFHTRSLSTISNFPTPAKSLGVPYSFDFSPNSGYFSVGSHNGVAHLFRLKHYSSY